MPSTYITRTPGSSGNRRTWTFSAWVKRGAMSDNRCVFSQCAPSTFNTNTHFRMRFGTTSNIQISTYNVDIHYTNRLFKDPSAWYHIVLAVDTTQATDTNRIKLYVNGEQITSFSSTNYPAQNFDTGINLSGSPFLLGADDSSAGAPSAHYDGGMSHVQLVDGLALAPTEFGETDATTGEWKLKTTSYGTPGTNGFHLKMEDSTNMDLDSSSNAHTFTTTGTLTATEDNPSNVFCTLNPLADNTSILSSGNTVNSGDGTNTTSKGTICPAKGKYYWEAKITTASSDYPMLGIYGVDTAAFQKPADTSYPGQVTPSYGIYGNGNVYANGSNTGSQSFTYATHDIIGTALDLDSATKVITWYKNGSQIATYNLASTTQAFSVGDYNGGNSTVISYNFGNGYFGTTAISSEGTNASGIGKFEYDVPTGFTALCTKGLNE